MTPFSNPLLPPPDPPFDNEKRRGSEAFWTQAKPETAGRDRQAGRANQTMEPEALPLGWEIRWPTPPEEHLPPPDEWWHQNDSEEWRNPELPLEDGKILVLDAEPLPPEEFPVFSVG